jgi:ATP-dependent Clp protease ATP-binding subunit ClpA
VTASRSQGAPTWDGRPVALVDVLPVLRICAAEAARTAHEHIGTEHLALAAMDGPDGLASIARAAGVDPVPLRALLSTCCVHARLGACDDEPRATPRVVRMLAVAAQMALLEREPAIRARHLVAVLLGEPGAVAWQGLCAAGLDPVTVRAGVLALAGSGPAPAAAESVPDGSPRSN